MISNLRKNRGNVVADWPLPVTSSPAEPSDKKQRLERLALLSKVGAGAFLLLVLLVALVIQITESGEIRSNVQVLGVDVGGMTRSEATEALTAARDQRLATEMMLVDGDREWTKHASELGLQIDVDAAVDEAFETGRQGFSLSRVAALWHLRSDKEVVGTNAISVSTAPIEAQLAPIAAEISQPRIDPALSINDQGVPGFVSAQVGRELDIAASAEQIAESVAHGESSIPLVVNEDVPPISDDQFAQARAQLDNALNAPIVIEAAGQTWEFDPSQIAYRLTLNPPTGDSPASVELDTAWVENVVRDVGFQVDRSPRSPRVWWDATGQLVVTEPPRDGTELQREAAIAQINEVFSGNVDSDTISLPITTTPAPEVPADLASLGLSQVFSEASTSYAGSIPERKHNIELAASLLNGALIMPGQTFSFNSEIGSTSIDAGFQIGYGIANQDGVLRTVPSVAGGICQVSSTVFQPVFASGYAINERYTHAYWISSYTYNGMVGLDATVDEASGLDFRWTNDSEFPVLLQAVADGSNFTVRLIGQKPNWEVELKEPIITNIQWADKDAVHYEPDTSLEPGQTLSIEHAEDGFDVRIVRIVRLPDGTERHWDVTTTYGMARNVVLVGSENGELPAGFPPS